MKIETIPFSGTPFHFRSDRATVTFQNSSIPAFEVSVTPKFSRWGEGVRFDGFHFASDYIADGPFYLRGANVFLELEAFTKEFKPLRIIACAGFITLTVQSADKLRVEGDAYLPVELES